MHHSMNLINRLIDHFLRIQKEWETIIIEQREALGKIAKLIDQLKDNSSLDKDVRELLAEITEQANRRI